VLALATDPHGVAYPALVVQRYGKGRTAAITLGDLWRGGLRHEKLQEDLGKLWRQLARWLTADVPQPLELRLLPAEGDDPVAVRLALEARDHNFEPLDNATIHLQVFPPAAATPIKLEPESSPTKAGLYHSDFVPRSSGPYRARASVFAPDGKRIGEVETGWAAEPLAEEFRSLAPNFSLMEQLAARTGGKVLTLSELEAFVDTLKHVKAPIMETYTYPLWHKPWILAAALLCLVAEWGLRRWKGLA
jgi:hypothetical protein